MSYFFIFYGSDGVCWRLSLAQVGLYLRLFLPFSKFLENEGGEEAEAGAQKVNEGGVEIVLGDIVDSKVSYPNELGVKESCERVESHGGRKIICCDYMAADLSVDFCDAAQHYFI